MSTRYLNHEKRRKQILSAAVDISKQFSYLTLTFNQVAKRVKCTRGLIIHHFGSMAALRDAVMIHAVATNDLLLIAQGLAHGNPIATTANEDIKKQSVRELLTGVDDDSRGI